MPDLQELDRRVRALENAGLDRRVSTLESERGDIMRELGELSGHVKGAREDVAEIKALLEERPSRVEFVQQQRAIESVRAKRRSVLPSLVEFEGPAGLKAKLSGFSGVTIVVVLVTALAGLGLWVAVR
jgi:chromosome segregation ATPase